MTTLPDGSPRELPEVEIIEGSPFEPLPASDDDDGPAEPRAVSRSPLIGGASLVVAAIALIVIALVVISRPGIEENAGAERAQTTLGSTSTTAPPAENAATDIAPRPDPPARQPIPAFTGNVPSDLPGIITAFDARGSLIVIDRAETAPVEIELELAPTAGADLAAAPGRVQVGDGPLLGFETALAYSEGVLIMTDRRTGQPDAFDVKLLDPVGAEVLVIERRGNEQLAGWFPEPDPESSLAWRLPDAGVDVLGLWHDEGLVVVHRAGQIWGVAPDGEQRPIADGHVVTYDRGLLVRLLCEDLDDCELAAGPPGEPNRFRVALPEVLYDQPVDRWGSTVRVSPEGDRLALVYSDGALPLPMTIDLTVGISTSFADGVNEGSPVAWSPDGRWLAYVYTDDVMVWSFGDDHSWRIPINRELQTLQWR